MARRVYKREACAVRLANEANEKNHNTTRSETPELQAFQPTTASVYLQMLPWTLRSFNEEVHKDVDDCIEHLEHVARINNCTDAQILDNVLSIEETACS